MMARPSQKQIELTKKCHHLNELIEKGFTLQTAQGEEIARFELAKDHNEQLKIIPILMEKAA